MCLGTAVRLVVLALAFAPLIGCPRGRDAPPEQANETTEGWFREPPLYVHLCTEMPDDDRLAWGEAAGDLNAELGAPKVWVAHGASIVCGAVNVCPSTSLSDPRAARGECVIELRYAPGAARDVAFDELADLVAELWGSSTEAAPAHGTPTSFPNVPAEGGAP